MTASPGEDDGSFCGFGGGNRGVVICMALVGCHPGEANLFGTVGSVTFNSCCDGMRTGREVDGNAQVIEAIGGGHEAVLAAKDGVAVDAAAHAVGSGDALAVDADIAG